MEDKNIQHLKTLMKQSMRRIWADCFDCTHFQLKRATLSKWPAQIFNESRANKKSWVLTINTRNTKGNRRSLFRGESEARKMRELLGIFTVKLLIWITNNFRDRIKMCVAMAT